ncbi:serine/threonine-protein kinase [Roseisolibacter agri]|uniref:non-specific serine/threonine protein kinase n=1 Tax=Roseisolibacter agri TaxID=2014610 RepID=A0AA37V735_9BACT|nr:serine/threonine-protein kinase [Roseisolibacter agri]GLC26096.1 hypothetical protein rosag_26090 [Roseisolibacter agri]
MPVAVRSGPSTPAYGAGSTPATSDRSPTPDTAADSARHTSWRHVAAHLQAALRGEFTIEREIGRGGMAAVYLARELRLDRWVALKVMSPSLLSGHGMVERFQQEAVTVANLSHANIVTIHSVRDVDDLHCFVMQYVEGRALDRILHEVRRLPLAAVQSALFQVGSALSYAHRRGVIHRDIKPANILIDTNGDAIVTDFGIAKVAEATGHTQTGVLIGTPSYMSPEQCLGVKVTASADQYALGLVAYELLAGQLPFTGPSLVVLQAQISQTPTPLEELAPDCPPEVAAAVMRMLAKDPVDRFPSIAQAVAALGGGPLGEDDPLRATLAVMAGAVPPKPPAPVPASVQVTLPDGRWEAGDALQASAIVIGSDEQPMPDVAVQWATDDTGVLRVDAETGSVTLLAPGRAMVRATAGDATGETALDVEAPRPDRIEIDAPPARLRACESWRPVVTVRDRRGAAMDVPVTLSVDDADVAVVADGAVDAVNPGTTTLRVTVDALTHEVPLRVAPAAVASVEVTAPDASLEVGERSHLTARALDGRGRVLHDAMVGWRSSAPDVATVNREGVVSALAAGSATIRAESSGHDATVALQVRPAAVASLTLSSPIGALHVGERARLSAIVRDRRGATLDRPLRWTTLDPKVLTVTPDGEVEARGLGVGVVTVECEGQQATAEVGVMVSSVTELFPPPPPPPAPPAAPPVRTPEPPTVPVEVAALTPEPEPVAPAPVLETPAVEEPVAASPAPAPVVPDEPPPRPTHKLDVTQFQVMPRLTPRESMPVAPPAPVAPREPAPTPPAPVAEPVAASLPPTTVEAPVPARPLSPRLIGAGVAAALVAIIAWWLASGEPEAPVNASAPQGQSGMVATADSASPPTADSIVAPAASPAPTPPPAPAPVATAPTPAAPPKAKEEPPAKSAAETRREEQERRRAEAQREAEARREEDARREAEARRVADSTRRAALAAAAARPAPTATLPAPTPTPAAPPRVPTTDSPLVNAAAANESRAGMQRAMSAYVSAIGARSIGELQRAFPSMPTNVRRGWEAMFGAVGNLNAQASDVQVTPIDGETGSGEMSLSVSYNNPANKRPCTQVTRVRMRLVRSGATWQINSIQQLSSSSSSGCQG